MPGNPISCHLITWGDNFEQALAEVEELGFHACEPFPRNALVYEQRPEEFQELLASHHLRLSALYGGGRFGDPARREEVIKNNTRLAHFLSALGVDRLVFGPGGPRTPGGTTAEELREAAKTINEAARACYDLGVLACVHPHLGTEIETEPEIDTIMESTDPRYVFFCPDSAHLTAAEIDVPRMIRRYSERMRYMHIKDLRAGEIDVALLWGPMAGYFARRGEPPLQVVPLLHETGGPRLVYRIAMGVRASDQNWKRELNRFIS